MRRGLLPSPPRRAHRGAEPYTLTGGPGSGGVLRPPVRPRPEPGGPGVDVRRSGPGRPETTGCAARVRRVASGRRRRGMSLPAGAFLVNGRFASPSPISWRWRTTHGKPRGAGSGGVVRDKCRYWLTLNPGIAHAGRRRARDLLVAVGKGPAPYATALPERPSPSRAALAAPGVRRTRLTGDHRRDLYFTSAHSGCGPGARRSGADVCAPT